ncbi:MAG: hypothetical protein WAN65_12125, partial [Candidatus Sulfotelmatobacter sp.]
MPISAAWKLSSCTLCLKRRAIVLVAILTALLCALAANATTTAYTYSGNDFTEAGSPYTTSDRVTGYFTIATLGDNLPFATITPTFFSFSDGVNTFDTSDGIAQTFEVATNSMGQINQWIIVIESSSDPLATSIH